MTLSELEHRGWKLLRLREGDLEVDVVPEKGGDIVAVRHRGTNLLWESPWGLRPKGEPADGATSVERWLQMYPGGWQTIFPNGGDESDGFGFHGEACLVPYSVSVAEHGIALEATLASVPAGISRRLSLLSGRLVVEETITNESSAPLDAMWSHHPAFGAPLISGSTRVECGATGFTVDDARDVEHGDLSIGAESAWPHAPTRDGDLADLRVLPGDGIAQDRFGYCTGFSDGWATITNPELGLSVRLDWDASLFPAAWYWLEARATKGFPWFGDAYVFAIEPASTWPGQGIANARVKGNGPLTFAPGERKTARVTLSVTAP